MLPVETQVFVILINSTILFTNTNHQHCPGAKQLLSFVITCEIKWKQAVEGQAKGTHSGQPQEPPGAVDGKPEEAMLGSVLAKLTEGAWPDYVTSAHEGRRGGA